MGWMQMLVGTRERRTQTTLQGKRKTEVANPSWNVIFRKKKPTSKQVWVGGGFNLGLLDDESWPN